MADQSTGDAKLVQYLTEAHGKEKELQDSLVAHIELASRPAYKKRLKDHLKETNQHVKLVERRIKKLGGKLDSSVPAKAVAVVADLPKRTAAAAKGAEHAIRGTGDEEKELKNAKTEYWNEHEEIANYVAIEILATELGDKETAQMARGIRRQEERMASFLEKQIPQLTKAVVKADIPREERASTRRRSSSSRKASSSRTASSSRSTGSSGGRGGATKRASARATKRASSGTKRRTAAKKRS